jgi:inhibitor of cysteine peptidase
MNRAALLFAAIAASSCATIEREEVAAPPSGGTVSMRTGTPLVVSLPPDPDTGYGWVLTSASPNLALIGGPDYTPAPRPPGLVGIGNTTAYRFRAVAPGPGSLEFAWSVPPGQPAPQPAKVVRYDVQVGSQIWLPSDMFGTVGMNSVRGGAYAPPTDAPQAKATDSLKTPAEAAPSGITPGSVKYWSN